METINTTSSQINKFNQEEINKIINKLDWKKIWDLIPVIAQDYKTWEILMQAYANKLALKRTLETWNATYWSRSRNELWEKWLTSWTTQEVYDIITDCDNDSIIYKIKQLWNPPVACHTWQRSCFFNYLASVRKKVALNIWE